MKKKRIIPTVVLASVPAVAATAISCTNQEEQSTKITISTQTGVKGVSVSPSQAETKKGVTITATTTEEGVKLIPESLKVFVEYAELPKVWYDTVVLDDNKSIEIILNGLDVIDNIFVEVETDAK